MFAKQCHFKGITNKFRHLVITSWQLGNYKSILKPLSIDSFHQRTCKFKNWNLRRNANFRILSSIFSKLPIIRTRRLFPTLIFNSRFLANYLIFQTNSCFPWRFDIITLTSCYQMKSKVIRSAPSITYKNQDP